MAKTWVLDTETKGTGEHVAPLSLKPRAGGERGLAIVQLPRPPRRGHAEEQPAPARRFKLVDVRAARVLGEDLDTRAAITELAGLSSALDARVYIWERERRRWQLLSLAETRALWELARREDPASAPGH
jgi:hypothetical protein